MRTAMLILALLLPCLVYGQRPKVIQLHGKLLNTDTVQITAWSNGQEILRKVTVDPLYSIILGEKEHYTIEFRSGKTVKYCTLLTWMMGIEDITLDVDFSENTSVIVKKAKLYGSVYEFEAYGTGRRWRVATFDYGRLD